jgi:hypothetical protein
MEYDMKKLFILIALILGLGCTVTPAPVIVVSPEDVNQAIAIRYNGVVLENYGYYYYQDDPMRQYDLQYIYRMQAGLYYYHHMRGAMHRHWTGNTHSNKPGPYKNNRPRP